MFHHIFVQNTSNRFLESTKFLPWDEDSQCHNIEYPLAPPGDGIKFNLSRIRKITSGSKLLQERICVFGSPFKTKLYSQRSDNYSFENYDYCGDFNPTFPFVALRTNDNCFEVHLLKKKSEEEKETILFKHQFDEEEHPIADLKWSPNGMHLLVITAAKLLHFGSSGGLEKEGRALMREDMAAWRKWLHLFYVKKENAKISIHQLIFSNIDLSVSAVASSNNLWLGPGKLLLPCLRMNKRGVYIGSLYQDNQSIVVNLIIEDYTKPFYNIRSDVASMDCCENSERQVQYADNLQFVGCYTACPFQNHSIEHGDIIAILTSCPQFHSHDRILIYSVQKSSVLYTYNIPGRVACITPRPEDQGFAFIYTPTLLIGSHRDGVRVKCEIITDFYRTPNMAKAEMFKCGLTSGFYSTKEQTASQDLKWYNLVVSTDQSMWPQDELDSDDDDDDDDIAHSRGQILSYSSWIFL